MEPMKRFIEETDGPRVIGQSLIGQKASLPPISTRFIEQSPPPADHDVTLSPDSYQTSTVSPSSSSPSEFSRQPSRSSTESSAPSLEEETLTQRFATMSVSTQGRHYTLPCILGDIVGCKVSFPPSDFDSWYRHSISHYYLATPPTHAMCIFCPLKFDSDIPDDCWRSRMEHISGHFEDGVTMANSRPDFSVLRDMRDKHCISQECWEICKQGNERPLLDGLHAHDWIPKAKLEKQQAEERKANSIIVPTSRHERRTNLPRARADGRSRSRLVITGPRET